MEVKCLSITSLYKDELTVMNLKSCLESAVLKIFLQNEKLRHMFGVAGIMGKKLRSNLTPPGVWLGLGTTARNKFPGDLQVKN